MRRLAFIAWLPALLIVACVDENPTDDITGNEPFPEVIFSIHVDDAPAFMDANLATANSLTAVYTVNEGRVMPAQVDGAYPGAVGSDANLLEGVGFGVYPNAEYTAGGGTWEDATPFRSVLTAELSLSGPGDAIRFCRTTGATCAEVVYEYGDDSFTGVILTLAANLPDTDVGEVLDGISAAIYGTGDAGLTVGLNHPDRVRAPLDLTPNELFTLEWVIQRSDTPGSLQYAVAVDGETLLNGSALDELPTDIVLEGGVVMEFDAPEAIDAAGGVDYGYTIYGGQGNFANVLGTPVDASPQVDMANAPLYLYPTVDPDYELLTYLGVEGEPHVLQFADGVIGRSDTRANPGGKARIWSVAFDGDDFDGTAYEGVIDQGGDASDGGGFYPSAPMCYSQIYPTLRASVEEGLHATVHQRMYANMANGVASADGSLPDLADGLSGIPFYYDVSYTPLGDLDGGDIEAFVAIGTDFADHNIDTYTTTPHTEVWSVTWTDSRATNFVAELEALIEALDANWGAAREALILLGQMTQEDYDGLVQLHEAMTWTRGMKDGAADSLGFEYPDDMTPPFEAGTCQGYDCLLEWTFQDVMLGTNNSGNNPDAPPALATVCLWGLAPSEEVPAQPAIVTGDFDNDHPAYDVIPADPGMPPVREQAAESISELVVGMYTEFHLSAFGTTVPASNFSVSMEVGDPSARTAPAFRSIEVRR